MERRKAIAAAAAISFTLLAGAGGIALSSGIVGANSNDGVGQLSPVSATSNPPVTIYVAESSITTPSASAVQAADATPVTGSSASTFSDAEDDDRHGDGHEDEHEYEGADDDD